MVTRATYLNKSENVRIGRDEDYWVEMDNFEIGMTATDNVSVFCGEDMMRRVSTRV